MKKLVRVEDLNGCFTKVLIQAVGRTNKYKVKAKREVIEPSGQSPSFPGEHLVKAGAGPRLQSSLDDEKTGSFVCFRLTTSLDGARR